MDKKLKIFEMFSGYGGASFGLKKAGIDFECVGFSEIDKYAIECYNLNHPNIKNYGDVTKINEKELPDFDLLTGGFPCQSFSVAGKGLGELDTRGTLFNDIIRIAEHKQPKYILLENVKGLLSKRHKETFNKIISELKRIGYAVHHKILNSKEHGTPQNRERVWIVCFRNDVVQPVNFEFPEKEELKIFLKDILESGVVDRDTSYCIDANYFKGTTLKGYLEKCRRQLVFEKGLVLPNATKKGYVYGQVFDGVKLEHPKSLTNRGRIGKQISPCIAVASQPGVILKDYSIRKLTNKECFRLMGFDHDQINLQNISNSQQYKLAGNGWDINLVSKVFRRMLSFN